MKDILVMFDLDGTLTDSAPGIIHSVRYALDKLGEKHPDMETLYKFVGPPLTDSFMEFCGFSEEKALLALQYYREYFSVDGKFENSVYNGIPDMLSDLKSKGLCLAVATGKPHLYAEQILDKFDLLKYFDFVAGSEFDGTRTQKSDLIRYALANCEKTNGIMVGDRKYDIEGALCTGTVPIGVEYGYAAPGELISAGAKHIARNVSDIVPIIFQIIDEL